MLVQQSYSLSFLLFFKKMELERRDYFNALKWRRQILKGFQFQTQRISLQFARNFQGWTNIANWIYHSQNSRRFPPLGPKIQVYAHVILLFQGPLFRLNIYDMLLGERFGFLLLTTYAFDINLIVTPFIYSNSFDFVTTKLLFIATYYEFPTCWCQVYQENINPTWNMMLVCFSS